VLREATCMAMDGCLKYLTSTSWSIS
jgi:hypothetical protein